MRALQAALDGERRARGLTWDQLAAEINEPFKHTPSISISVGTIRTMTAKRSVTSAMLTNLANGPLIGFPRVMALVQWLGRPASDFVRVRSK
jgi:hypothetical protein